jgi:hypothetical protein
MNLGLGLNIHGIRQLSSRLANLGLWLSVLVDQLIEQDAFQPLW